jgi:hypothetical protein
MLKLSVWPRHPFSWGLMQWNKRTPARAVQTMYMQILHAIGEIEVSEEPSTTVVVVFRFSLMYPREV